MTERRHHQKPARATQPALEASRRLVWLLLRSPSQFDDEETAIFSRIQQHPDVVRAQALAQEFQALVRQRRAEALDGWLTASRESGILELHSFAMGLQHEYASIRAALSEPWSTGQVRARLRASSW